MSLNKFLRIIFPIILFSTSNFAQNGFVYIYYSTGEIEGVLFYANDVLEGTSYWYHTNGNLKAEKTYSNGKLNGFSKEFYDTGLMKSEISITEGVRDGLSKYYYENGALEKILSYENGVLIKEVNIDYDSLYVAPLEAYKYANTQERIKENEDLFLCEGADICPKPVGGMEEVIKHLVFPEHAKLYGLEGFVTVVATIDTIGKVETVTVLNDLGLGTKEAAIDAVKSSRFLPGEKDGRIVKSKVLFKIPFLLNNKVMYAKVFTENKAFMSSKSRKENPTKDHQALINVEDTVEKDDLLSNNFKCDIDICAKPKNGINAILKNFIMPSVVKRKKLTGEVVVEADVDIYGNVRDTKVISGIGYGCDIAVEVAILQTEFEPGIKEGKPIRSNVVITVPIRQSKK